MLEGRLWPENPFVTLTYRDEELRDAHGNTVSADSGAASVSPLDHQLFVKRLRKAYEPEKFRFYGVGEYGDISERPHLHYALFNFPVCRRGRTRRVFGTDRPDWQRCCPVCRLVGETWGKGDVDLGLLEEHSAQYLAGYVIKKMTRDDDLRLNGRKPEFCRMSRRPGIGYHAMWEVASELMRFNLEDTQVDVPSTLRHGRRLMPLGRYLTKSLRKMVGHDEKTPEQVLQRMAEELQPLREAARGSSETPSFRDQIIEANKGKVASFEAREKIKRQKRNY